MPEKKPAPPRDANAAPQMGPDMPIMNAVRCIDCDRTYTMCPPFEECPDEPGEHAAEAVFVTRTPLGYSDDEEYLYPNGPMAGVYEYPAREPRKDEAYDEFTDPLA